MHKVVIKGNYYGRTRTLPDLNDYLHECARHPQMGAKMKRDYQMIVCNAIRTQLPRLTITNPIIIHYNFYEPDKQRDKGNIFSFADKVFQDALQKCGVIKNDGWKEIDNFTHDFYHILGGNDVATDLIEDLKGLPTEPQKKKEGVEDDT